MEPDPHYPPEESRPSSSVGQSRRLVSVRSPVRAGLGLSESAPVLPGQWLRSARGETGMEMGGVIVRPHHPAVLHENQVADGAVVRPGEGEGRDPVASARARPMTPPWVKAAIVWSGCRAARRFRASRTRARTGRRVRLPGSRPSAPRRTAVGERVLLDHPDTEQTAFPLAQVHLRARPPPLASGPAGRPGVRRSRRSPQVGHVDSGNRLHRPAARPPGPPGPVRPRRVLGRRDRRPGERHVRSGRGRLTMADQQDAGGAGRPHEAVLTEFRRGLWPSLGGCGPPGPVSGDGRRPGQTGPRR